MKRKKSRVPDLGFGIWDPEKKSIPTPPVYPNYYIKFVKYFCAFIRILVWYLCQNFGFKNTRPETDFFSEKQRYFCPFQTLTCLLKAEFPTEPIAHFSLEQISKYLGSKNNYSESIEKSIPK